MARKNIAQYLFRNIFSMLFIGFIFSCGTTNLDTLTLNSNLTVDGTTIISNDQFVIGLATTDITNYDAVIFPAGTTSFAYDGSVIFSITSDMTISGMGRDKTYIQMTGTPTNDEQIFSVQSGVNFKISNLTILGTDSQNSQSTKGIYHVGGGGSLTIEDVTIKNFENGIKTNNSLNLYTNRVRITDVNQGYLLVASASDTGTYRIYNPRIKYVGTTNQHHGIYFYGNARLFLVEGGDFNHISGYGIHLSSGTASDSTDIKIDKNRIRVETYGGILADLGATYASKLKITNNTFFGGGTGVDMRMNNAIVSGNHFNTDIGIIIKGGSSYGLLTNNLFDSTSIAIDFPDSTTALLCRYWDIMENKITSLTGSNLAYRFRGGRNIFLSSNEINYSGIGIRVEQNADSLYFVDERYIGNTYIAYYVSETGLADPIKAEYKNCYVSFSDSTFHDEVSGVSENGTWR